MRLPALLVVAPLLLNAQVEPRCSEVKSALHAVEMGHAALDPDLRAAGAACDASADLRPLHLTYQRIFAWIEQAASGSNGRDRFAVLPLVAKAAFRAGDMDAAQSYARELLQMAPNYTREQDYGDAIYDGYSVLGRVALHRENLPLARQYLMNAASTPGSPALSRNGPNMMLVKEMLEKGQAPVVLQFLILCREFWKQDGGRLSAWSDAIRQHHMPDFGSNLDY
jgi:hypothetical protein